MLNFKPGTDVPLTFSLVDESGATLTPTALRWRVLDEAEVVLQDWTVISAMPVVSTQAVVVLAVNTALVSPALRGIRTVEMEVTSAAGVLTLTESIMLQGSTALAFGINTFQTFGQAMLLAENFTPDQTSAWVAADRETKEKALIQAYERILQLPIRTGGTEGWNQSMLTQDTVISNIGARLPYMTPAQMANLYPPLMVALRSAQIAEANSVLNFDPIAAARDDGMISMTVGESSQFFRAAKPLDLPVCKAAMAYLQRWVRITGKIGRA